jgi:FkbM family methyltransferase
MEERTTRDLYIWGSTLHRGDTVLDVGAGIGGEVPTFSKEVGDTGRVIAIEAHPVTFGFLKRNVRANRIDNVSVHQAAVTGAEGTVAIANDLDDHIGNSIVMENNAGSVDVPAVTLDGLIDSENIDSVALLKMNIEGAEVGALQGASTTLTVTRQVCICCHDFKADRTGDESLRTSRDVEELLLEAGFELNFRQDDSRPWVRDTVYGVKS